MSPFRRALLRLLIVHSRVGVAAVYVMVGDPVRMRAYAEHGDCIMFGIVYAFFRPLPVVVCDDVRAHVHHTPP